MSRLSTPEEANLQPDTLEALAPVRMNGKLADVYLQFANSEPALRAYLHMEQASIVGSLSTREIEAIKHWLSLNGRKFTGSDQDPDQDPAPPG